MQNVVIDGHDLEDQFPGKLVRHWRPEPNGGTTEVTAGFVVSRWPITPLDTHDLGAAGDYLIAGAVQRPEGPFAVIAVHPRSPRTAARWEVGNAVIEAVATLTRRMAEQGLPVVVLSDLNSTPTGYRSRHLYQQAKLRRAKPLFSWTATYPDQITWGSGPTRSLPLAWPAAIAIDDALITPGIGVSGWTVGPRLASEHLPVIVELTIPQGSVPNPASPPSTPLPAGR
jgi:endonuclease/exonuclease/phosphatase family metal-dependent hydrolase